MKTKAILAIRIALASATFILAFTGTSARAGSAAPVVAATPIQKVPFTITKPGLYIVKKNLVYNGTTSAITIAANDVTLDLGGHVLSSGALQDATNTSNGVRADGKQDITIRNGVLRNFYQGVNLNQSTNLGRVLVEDLVVSNSGYVGIDVGHALDIEIRGCHVLETGYQSATLGAYGIFATGDNVKIAGNVVANMRKLAGLGSDGIYCSVAQSGLVDQNTVSAVEVGTVGIQTASGALQAIIVTENTVTKFFIGLSINGPGKYRSNLTIGCAFPFDGGTPVGSENN